MPERFGYTPEEVPLDQLEALANELLRGVPADFSSSFGRHYELRQISIAGNFTPEEPQFKLTEFTEIQTSLFGPTEGQIVDKILILAKRSTQRTGDMPGYENTIKFTCDMLAGRLTMRGGEQALASEQCIVTQLQRMKVARDLE